ncbi:hypothetical protein HPP92_015502 [Vanilla planifolia]|uniref:Uncharacterized protein n=1 Tax=Vanilla planifolia TaxID=51239 RepID=A0A835QI12_VANPL|nr:hypothetical protein HPP92_015502 [Vanilla planifolia]
MEGKKSFVDEFFPKTEAAKPSKFDALNSIFPPRPTGDMKDSAQLQWSESWRKTAANGVNGKSQSTAKKNGKPVSNYELSEPCLMSSSVHYGGREDFIPEASVTGNFGAQYNYKKDKEDYLGNSEGASRGDWWQGSYYY